MMDSKHSSCRVQKSSKPRNGLVFPWVLHQLLSEAEDNDNGKIVSWLPSGKAFKVHNRDLFSSKVMPQYFSSRKYKSFQRSLNIWGFTCVRRGADKGSVYHRFFQRDNIGQCQYMSRMNLTVAPDRQAPKSSDSSESSPQVERVPSFGRSETFPAVLHALLDQGDFEKAVKWMPHGKAFKVIDPVLLEKSFLSLLPLSRVDYFGFVDTLLEYGFIRILKGRDKDAFYHEFFVRGLPHLCSHLSSPAVSRQFNQKAKLHRCFDFLYDGASNPGEKAKTKPTRDDIPDLHASLVQPQAASLIREGPSPRKDKARSQASPGDLALLALVDNANNGSSMPPRDPSRALNESLLRSLVQNQADSALARQEACSRRSDPIQLLQAACQVATGNLQQALRDVHSPAQPLVLGLQPNFLPAPLPGFASGPPPLGGLIDMILMGKNNMG